jgi:serine/threonine protein kinase
MTFCSFKCLSEICGFVYFRDLKIENLLLDEDNNIKLIGMTFFF